MVRKYRVINYKDVIVRPESMDAINEEFSQWGLNPYPTVGTQGITLYPEHVDDMALSANQVKTIRALSHHQIPGVRGHAIFERELEDGTCDTWLHLFFEDGKVTEKVTPASQWEDE